MVTDSRFRTEFIFPYLFLNASGEIFTFVLTLYINVRKQIIHQRVKNMLLHIAILLLSKNKPFTPMAAS